jgi:hypothetical protein
MPTESDIDKLYKDAYFFHLIKKGLSDYMAEFEANRYIRDKKEL